MPCSWTTAPLWWNHANGYGLTRLSVDLMKQGIRLYIGAVRHPQTQGKVERLHRTLEEALQHATAQRTFPGWQEFLRNFRAEYNYLRPHEALNLQVPAARYRPESRAAGILRRQPGITAPPLWWPASTRRAAWITSGSGITFAELWRAKK